MIAFRQVDGRYPFLWESAAQPAGRWHGEGEGPAHYFADTPDAAWAEFLRHEEITDEADLRTIRRQMWAVEIGGAPNVGVYVPDATLSGGPSTYACLPGRGASSSCVGNHQAGGSVGCADAGARKWRGDRCFRSANRHGRMACCRCRTPRS
jgi:hypothetical protein